MSWIEDIISPQTRKWEEFYRNRFQHDRIVRSTHGVNCTGGCSWQIHVKDGIVVWETQQLTTHCWKVHFLRMNHADANVAFPTHGICIVRCE
jgi:anaerobic selenocysteine-containing dehydrogenase